MLYSLIFILLSLVDTSDSRNKVIEITTDQSRQLLKVGNKYIYQDTSVRPPKDYAIIFSTVEIEEFIKKRGNKNSIVVINGTFLTIKEKEYLVILKIKDK